MLNSTRYIYSNKINDFFIPLFSIQKDASEYFTINSTTGYLYQTKQFDYEESTIQCGIGKEGGFLNITAEVNYIYISQLAFKSLCKCKLHIYIILFNSITFLFHYCPLFIVYYFFNFILSRMVYTKHPNL